MNTAASKGSAIRIEDLSFSYVKDRPFISQMSFEVASGEIFGFLGPSGAGKSTLQKILTGVLLDYQGKVQVGGIEVKHHRPDFYQMIGVDFEFSTLYGKFTALENLNFFASLYEGPKSDPMELLRSVGLEKDAHLKVSAYSKGMKSRLNFVKALLHDPAILFLDEPMSGLDPFNARAMKELILKQKARGKTIVLTTHNMHDAEYLCDRVAFIIDGQVVALDDPEALKQKDGKSLEDVFIELTGRELSWS